MDHVHYKSATELASLIRRKKIGCLELLDHYLARVERYNPELNAVIWKDNEKARKRAKAADAALTKGERVGPAARRADDHQGKLRGRGLADHVGRAGDKDNVRQPTALSASACSRPASCCSARPTCR